MRIPLSIMAMTAAIAFASPASATERGAVGGAVAGGAVGAAVGGPVGAVVGAGRAPSLGEASPITGAIIATAIITITATTGAEPQGNAASVRSLISGFGPRPLRKNKAAGVSAPLLAWNPRSDDIHPRQIGVRNDVASSA